MKGSVAANSQYRLRVPIHLRGLLRHCGDFSLADGSALPNRPSPSASQKSRDYLFHCHGFLVCDRQVSSRFGKSVSLPGGQTVQVFIGMA